MKKILILLLAVTFVGLTSCDKPNSTPNPTTDEPSTTITTPQDDKTITKEDETANMKLTLKINDTRITTSPGDIVLYSSNQIVIFYDSNTWSYTKLGHINLSKSELTDLLGDEDVVVTIDLK